jgi:hypothetical protein
MIVSVLTKEPMELDDLIKERDEALTKRDALDKYIEALNTIIATKKIGFAAISSQNSNLELNNSKRAAVLEFIREKIKVKPKTIITAFKERGINITDAYIYNILSSLYREGTLDKKDNEYSIRKSNQENQKA